MAEQLIGIGLDLLAVERLDRGDDELDAGFGLEVGELGFERLAGFAGMTLAWSTMRPVSARKVDGGGGQRTSPIARTSASASRVAEGWERASPTI